MGESCKSEVGAWLRTMAGTAITIVVLGAGITLWAGRLEARIESHIDNADIHKTTGELGKIFLSTDRWIDTLARLDRIERKLDELNKNLTQK